MMARAWRPEQAFKSLLNYLTITRRSGFHCNYLKKPIVTLEGNFAAGQAVHEMLLQSWGGKLRVFPEVPAQWQDAAFQADREVSWAGNLIRCDLKAHQTLKLQL